jgi:Tfp pilus assembly protein PilN
VLPEDVWLTTLDAKTPIVPGVAVAAAPTTGPDVTGFMLQGFTYSQEGVARLLSRLEVIHDLQNVTLQWSTQTTVADRPIYQFSIGGSVRAPGATS